MDPDTQRLIERTRQRREVLNQRMAGMPEAAPRKRRTPVLESDGSEKILTEKQNNQDDLDEPYYDSPKRQCLREAELVIKQDTPAIQSVQSRLKGLANLYKDDADEENVEVPTPKPRKSVTSPPLERKVTKSPYKSPAKLVEPPTNFGSSRKGRFAALAEHLNNMEDDLTHHVVKKEEKKPKWQPPKSEPAPHTSVVSSGKGPAPMPPTSTVAPKVALESSPQKTFAPVPSVISSPSSTLARNSPLRASKVCAPVSNGSTPAASTLKQKEHDPTELSVSQRMSQMQEKLSNTPLVKRQQKDEPTAYPVGARMSAWETMTAANNVSNIKKVNPAESTPLQSKQRPVTSFTPKVNEANEALPPIPPPPPQTNTGITPAKSFRDCIEEKASKMWSKKGVELNKSPEKKSQSPTKSLNRSPSKVIHSPNKVSVGTKTFQKILVDKSQDSTTTSSALAAQERASRMAELEAIQNRWKNGVLREDNAPVESVQTKDGEKPESKTPEKVPTSSKREDARNRARAEFNTKLAGIGLDCERDTKGYIETAQPTQATATLVTKEAPKSQTSSIYNLIKKREETNAQTVEEKKVTFNDSFDDSDDDADKKIPRSATKKLTQQSSDDSDDFKKPEVPKMKDISHDANSVSTDEEFHSDRLSEDLDDDDISLKGFVSEAVRRESILPAPPLRSSQSSLDSYEDDRGTADSEGSSGGPSSKHDGYGPDDESMDEDEVSNRNAVDDLLDEAMSDTTDDYDPDMDPKNVVLRRPPSKNTYDPDMDPNNVQMRHKVNTAVPIPAQRHHKAAGSTDEDDDDHRPYSLQAYRKSANVHQHVMEPIIRKSRYADSYVEDEEEEMVMPAVTEPRRDDRRAVQERIKELQELVQLEQNVIMQTSNALNKCCMGNSYFAGSAEQVECNKVLLIACQKRQCYMTEIQKLKETGILNVEGPGPKGSLTISDIRLPLKKEFVTKIGSSHDNTTHYFILLFKNGPQIICTQMLSTHDPMMRGSLDFPNLIKINGITSNFKLVLDIYAMSVSKEFTKDKKKKTPKKGKGYAMALESPGGPAAVRTTSFTQVSSLVLTMKCLDKNSFHLERLPYLSPLYGQIFMRLKCLMEASVEEKGFLTMFDDVSGFGAWHRRWCVLSGNKLCVWKYPDDETRKDPMAIIDLKRCITEKVGLVPRDVCARPNTFEMVTVRQPLKGEHDTLITKTYNSTTTVRHQMSADSKEERIVWCNKINKTLANLRTWNADALKPMKPAASSSYH